jgi:hypothetical protein
VEGLGRLQQVRAAFAVGERDGGNRQKQSETFRRAMGEDESDGTEREAEVTPVVVPAAAAAAAVAGRRPLRTQPETGRAMHVDVLA